jgi:hypothetical protein
MGKVDMYQRSPLLEVGFEWYEADSGSRHVDEKYYNAYSNLMVPILKGDAYLKMKEEALVYLFSNPSWVNRQRLSVGVEYNKKPLLWLSAHYLYSIYSDDIKYSHNFNEEVNIKPIGGVHLAFSHSREDVLDNGTVLKNNLKRDDYKVRANLEPNRRISFGADYKFSDYNDGNSNNTYGIDAALIASYEPRFLKLTYRYEEYGFDKPNDYYFTPSSFHTNTVGLEWRHFLNKEELFWGTNDTYYTLRYAVNFDVHDQNGHTLYADFHKDWNDRFSTHVEWYIKIYDHQATYREQKLLGYLKYYF